MERIPALSIRQPWAELIISGKKTIEIRSWYTEYRGLLWVHTGIKAMEELEREFGRSDLFKGGYVGSVRLDAVISLDRERWEAWNARHLCPGQDYEPGLFGWVLSAPHKFEKPIPGPGQLNLFYPSDELNKLLHQANSAN